MDMNERQKRILKALIDEYVSTAEPVGSKSLAIRFDNEMSSATIRAEMAELEALGLLDKPHTSAGRVPSTTGYRFYVDELMPAHELTREETSVLNQALTLRIKELDRIVQDTNSVLSGLMHYASFMVYPSLSRVTVHRIEAIKIDDLNYVVVLVASTGLVKNQVVRISTPIDGKTYHVVMILLNDTLRGVSLAGDLPDMRDFYDAPPGADELIGEIYSFIKKVSLELTGREVFFDGVGNLLRHPEFRDAGRAEQVLDYLSSRERTKNIATIGSGREGSGLVISIGAENNEEPLKNLSVLMSPYQMPGSLGGFIGLVGPTRMDYARVSARLSYFTNGLSRLLREAFVDDIENKNNME